MNAGAETPGCEAFVTELPDLLYGELPSERREIAQAHAEACSACGELLRELQGVKGAMPSVAPPAALGTRLKLMARDELLAEGPAPLGAAGGPLHLAAVAVLAACLVGFALGIAFERRQPQPSPTQANGRAAASRTPTLPVPDGPAQLPPETLPIGADPPPTPVPGAGTAWQRVLYDAGQARLQANRLAEARTFFARAAALDPQGSLAAAAEVGAAEALLRQGKRADALKELEATRRAILAGKRYGTGAVLQRIAELVQEAND